MTNHPSAQPRIFISGGAAGIGKATARLFAAKGWFVGLADIDEAGAALLQREIGDDAAIALLLDVTSPESWSAALGRFAQARGGLDVLLNNAGILISGPFCSNDLMRHRAVIDVNVAGVLNGCYLAKSHLAAGGCIINMSSTAAIYGQASLATYAASKFAVRGLTEGLSIEWQAEGIRVVDVMPLFVRTGMVKDMNALSYKRLGAHLTPEDVALVIWRAATYQGGHGKVHWTVGRSASWLRRLTALAPESLTRAMMKRSAT